MFGRVNLIHDRHINYNYNVNDYENNKINVIIKSIIGKRLEEAEKIYHNLRVIKNNNTHVTIYLNYCKERCNIELENGLVTKVDGFY